MSNSLGHTSKPFPYQYRSQAATNLRGKHHRGYGFVDIIPPEVLEHQQQVSVKCARNLRVPIPIGIQFVLKSVSQTVSQSQLFIVRGRRVVLTLRK